eukprot:TRINITY_DN791_c0_g1_i1.p1 TRINITY_DN791_c0_g1~~TRINITY_DN791_c0_g1_i1.p1  ORF type:complete len:276 (+),score=81.59 TRINITY_DN791_c0_g1_i1:250-1077(+)
MDSPPISEEQDDFSKTANHPDSPRDKKGKVQELRTSQQRTAKRNHSFPNVLGDEEKDKNLKERPRSVPNELSPVDFTKDVIISDSDASPKSRRGTHTPKSGDGRRKSKKKVIDYVSEGEDGRLRAMEQNQMAKTKPKLEFKRNEIGDIIYKGHPSWILMQNIQTGIRQSVGKSSNLIDGNSLRQLKHIERSEAFFKSPNVLRFPPEGSSETAAHKTGLFKFKDYCPLVFRHLREKFGIDPGEYMVSLCNALEDGKNALRELPTPGKSGSFVLFLA